MIIVHGTSIPSGGGQPAPFIEILFLKEALRLLVSLATMPGLLSLRKANVRRSAERLISATAVGY
ncbi:MAG TPA: hypothetical protein DCP56_01915 [Spirochaetaceae bacterium]|nr:hypothetical protein [Spirochaetaceae bacterium]